MTLWRILMLATVLGWLTIYIALILFSMYYFISVRTRTGDIINYLFTYELSTLSFKRKKVVSPMAMYHLYGIHNVIHVALTCVWNKLTKYYKILRWKLCLAFLFTLMETVTVHMSQCQTFVALKPSATI